MKNLNENLILEEYRQRYEQYRMHNENRNKYIHFYFIFYFAFWGLVGFLAKDENLFLWQALLWVNSKNIIFAYIFILHSIFSSIFIISLITFRQMQTLEGCTINKIKGFSNRLRTRIKYPMDRRIFKKVVTSQTPLILLIFMLNIVSAVLSFIFIKKFIIDYYLWGTRIYYIFAIIQIVIWICTCCFLSRKYRGTMVTWKKIEETPECDC